MFASCLAVTLVRDEDVVDPGTGKVLNNADRLAASGADDYEGIGGWVEPDAPTAARASRFHPKAMS
jgi:hypothetical protein